MKHLTNIAKLSQIKPDELRFIRLKDYEIDELYRELTQCQTDLMNRKLLGVMILEDDVNEAT